ncbi:hypothetical protein HK103_001902 [Boothiomyces macroporosus]|uniref:Uncharacterized protein n=1 Tax=Boothiomyces macroporosus TaxID=261099 RepID=A0AAD5UDH2_9FUNG|nr:hypothetical protein HK103_001902 [Boothiomyces macroporosus]
MVHLIILFIGGVYADYLFEGQFYSKDCQGPPTTMYIFETVNTYSYIPWTPDLNETWAPYFKFHSYAYSVEQAGTVFVELPGISCIASVRYQESQPYWSGYTQFYSSGYGLDSIPKAANGLPYCFLLSNDFNDTTILNGYNGIYLKPDNNQCYDDYYRCSLNGTFTYYTNAGCSGQSETIILGSNLATFNSTYLGNISAQFYTVEGAAVFFSWDAIVPYEDIVPYFDNAGDWVTLVFVIATLFIGTFMIYRTALNVMENKFTLPKGINLASQLSYLGYYITGIMYWTWICNSDQLSIVTTFRWIFLGLGSLLDCLLTSLLISDVLFVHQKARARIIAFPLLILVHVGLYGCSYGGVYIVNIGPPTFSNQLIAFFIQWHKISMLWMLLTFIFTSTVPILVAFKIISLQVDKYSKLEIDKVDRWLKYYIGGQIAASGLFAVTFIIQQYTYVLGNDFAALNSNMFLMFGVACHTFFTSKIYGIISASSEYVKAKLRGGPVNITQTAQRYLFLI